MKARIERLQPELFEEGLRKGEGLTEAAKKAADSAPLCSRCSKEINEERAEELRVAQIIAELDTALQAAQSDEELLAVLQKD